MNHYTEGKILPVAQEVGRLSGLAHPLIQLPWITLSTATIVWLMEALPRAQTLFQYDRTAIAGGELWRIFTGHLTHWNGEHFLWDVIVFIVLGAVCERYSRKGFVAFLGLSAMIIAFTVWAGLPGMIFYRGLSGIDAGLYIMVLMMLALEWREKESPKRMLLGMLFMLAFFVKVGYEIATGDTVFVQNTRDFVPVPLAHLAGAAVGAATVFLQQSSGRMGNLKFTTGEAVQSHG